MTVTTRKNGTTTLRLEALEGRMTPAAFVNSAGDLVVSGTTGNDLIVVDHLSPAEAGGLGWWGAFRVSEYEVTGYQGPVLRHTSRFDDLPFPVPSGDTVWGGNVFLYGKDGNDTLINNTRLATWA